MLHWILYITREYSEGRARGPATSILLRATLSPHFLIQATSHPCRFSFMNYNFNYSSKKILGLNKIFNFGNHKSVLSFLKIYFFCVKFSYSNPVLLYVIVYPNPVLFYIIVLYYLVEVSQYLSQKLINTKNMTAVK